MTNCKNMRDELPAHCLLRYPWPRLSWRSTDGTNVIAAVTITTVVLSDRRRRGRQKRPTDRPLPIVVNVTSIIRHNRGPVAVVAVVSNTRRRDRPTHCPPQSGKRITLSVRVARPVRHLSVSVTPMYNLQYTTYMWL